MLSPDERQQLARFCATLLPLGGDAADSLAGSVVASVGELHGSDGVARLGAALRLLDNRFVNLFVAGRLGKFSRMADDERQRLLLAWSSGRSTLARTVFQAIKRLAMFLHYTEIPPSGYDPDVGGEPSQVASPIRPFCVDGIAQLSADVLVIGSGAGGGVVAGELAAAGFDVLVVEKGRAPADIKFPSDERRGFAELYERRGSLTTVDRGVTVLAGSTLGGGTAINWMTCLEPPEEVLDQWRREFGFTAATSVELRSSIAAVSARLNVNVDESPAAPTDAAQSSAQNAVLERGCRALGYRVAVIPRNARGCATCDTCSFGCRHGGKQDMRRTYLADAAAHGARFLVGAEVLRVTHDGGVATGAEIVVGDGIGARRQIAVSAKIVVAAAGAIHTPALLVRSGLANRHIGANLHLHPTTAVCGEFAEPIRSWSGPPQTRYSDEFANLDGRGHGVRLEVSPAHPGLWGLALAWPSQAEHRRRMERVAHLANVIVIARDEHAGRVAVDRAGQSRLEYRIAADDARRLLRGAVEGLRVLAAAGATELLSPHQRNLAFRPGDASSSREFERYLTQVAAAGWRVNDLGLFSAHQLSSCRIAASAKQGAVRPDGQLHELENLFVADGSILPTACGVNPMLTIAALAHHVAQQIKSKTS
ncbi:MAG: GMC family oxidoreductase [Pirellulales bacterium]